MTKDDLIEKRAINRAQIQHVIDVLVNNKSKEKNFYNYKKAYTIKKINDQNYLFDKVDDALHDGLIIPLEEMYDACKAIHEKLGFQGRKPILEEAKKLYGNVTRPIVELFLDFSEQYQTKKKIKKSWISC